MENIQELHPEPILVEDYTSQSRLWAEDVGIPDFKVIADTYVAYHVVLLTRAGARVDVYRRYSDFLALREKLELARPLCTLPSLPAKSVLFKFDDQFVRQRRQSLEYFLQSVVLNPETCDATAVKRFFTNG